MSYVGSPDQVLHCKVEALDKLFMAMARAQRTHLWDNLLKFGKIRADPWLIVGDFNTYLAFEEKIGFSGVNIEPCADLPSCMAELGLEDLSGTGFFHTWSNNQEEDF